LTAIGAIILIWHLFRVRRDGGIAAPSAGRNDIPPGERVANPLRIPRRELLRREVIAMLASSGLLILVATILPAPIAQPMNISLASVTEPRAPWFFLWVQETLKLGDPFLLGVLTPILLLIFISSLPYLLPRIRESELGRWFPSSGRAVQIIAFILTFGILILSILALIQIP
jgi:quinol-cytochrome oxidoreductase complex cytochrome b subunit